MAEIVEKWVLDGTTASLMRGEESGNEWTELISVSGVKSDNISHTGDLNDPTNSTIEISIPASALNGTDVTVNKKEYQFVEIHVSGDYQSEKEFDESSINYSTEDGTLTVKGSTKAYYDDSDGSAIIYHPPVEGVLATVSGLQSGSSASGKGKTITLTAADLPDTDVTLTPQSYVDALQVDPSTLGLALSLGGKSTLGFDKQPAQWDTTTTSGTAKYTQTTNKGWTLESSTSIKYTEAVENAELITVTGLKENSAPTIDEETKTVTISQAILDQTNGAVTGEGYTFKLSGTETTDTDSKIGLVDNPPEWSENTSGTTKYYYTTTEGWTLSDSNITYTAATVLDDNEHPATILATVTGLADGEAVSIGSDGSTIAISKEMFGDSANDNATITLTNGTGSNYKLAPAQGSDTSSKYKERTSSISGSEIQGTLTDYITLADDAKTVTYHAEQVNQVLATIEGLKSGLTTAPTISGTTITLTAEMLDKKPIYIDKKTVTGTPNYEFALSGDDIVTEDNVIDTNEAYAIKSVANGVATIQGKTKAYYTTEGSTVTYHEAHDVDVATINGLNTSATKNNVTIANGVITIAEDALTSSNISISNIKVGSTEDYELKLVMGSMNAYKKVGFRDSGNYWTVNGTTATYQKYTKKGWTLNGDSTAIQYNADNTARPTTLLTISNLASGLSATVAAGGASDTAKIEGITVDDVNKKITLAQSVLNKDADNPLTVNLKSATSSYEVALYGASSDDDDKKADTLGFKKNANEWDFNEGTATYQYTTDEGWTLNGKTVTYSASATTGLVSISGLSAGTDTEELTMSGTGGTSSIELTAGMLDTTKTIELTDLDTTDGFNFNLALDTGISNVTTVNAQTGLSLAGISTGTAEIKTTRAAGWSFVGSGSTKLTYAEAVDNTLATISGLSTAATDSDVKFTTGSKIINLTQGALSAGSVTLTNTEGNDYRLSFEGVIANAEGKYTFGFGNAGNNWKNEGASATYRSYTGAGWTLNDDGKGVTYTSKDDTYKDLAVITGLTEAGNVETNFTVNNGTIKLDAAALSGTSTINIDDKDASDGTDYILGLVGDNGEGVDATADDGKYGFKIDDPTFTAVGADGKAIYQYKTNEGWSLSSASSKIVYTGASYTNLATIEGLKEGATLTNVASSYVAANGYSGVFTLTEDMLGDNNIILNNVEGVGNYSLSFGGESTLGFENKDGNATGKKDSWSVSGTSAVLQREIEKGWTLATNGSSATFTEARTDNLATITGLKSGITREQFTGLSIAKGSGSATNIELVSYLLDETNGNKVEITSGSGYNYALKLAGGISVLGSSAGASATTTALDFTEKDLGIATVKETRGKGWVFNGSESTSMTYYEEVNNTLATISGLSKGFAEEKVNLGTASGTETTIYIEQGALSKGIAILDSTTYSLALSGASAGDEDENANTFGFKAKENEWKVGSDSTSAIYQSLKEEGWTLAGKSITYKSSDETRENLFTVSGLKNGFTKDQISIEGTSTIKVKAAALSTAEISFIDNNTDDEYKDFKFAFDETSGVSTDRTKYGFNNENNVAGNGWEVVDGANGTKTAYYKHTTGEGWTIDGTRITYSGQSVVTLATITGLSGGVSTANLENIVEGGSFSTADNKFTGTFKLTQDLLSDGNITLTNAAGGSYKLSLGGTSTLGFKSKGTHDITEDYWNINGTTATYIHDYGKGWTLATDGLSATFSAADNETLATITNLGTLSYANSAAGSPSSPSAIIGITVDNSKNITLSKDVLSKTAVGGVSAVTDFTFKLADDNDNDNKIGFDPEDNYWTIDNGTATYQYDDAEGWTYAGSSITYTARKTTELAKLTGLGSLSYVTAGSSASITGINVTDKKVTLDNRVLGTQGVTLTSPSDDYTLDLDTSPSENQVTTSATDKNIWTYDNGTATYKKVTSEYYQLQGTTVAYTAEADKAILANVTGLSKDLVLSNDRTQIGTKDDNGTYKEGVITVVDNGGSGTITVKEGALNASNIANTTENSAYKLVTEGVASSEENNPTWSVKNGTATLTVNISEGYTVSGDGKTIEYAPKEDGKVLMVISGLNSAVKASDGSIEGIVIDDNSKKVILSKDVLGTSTSTNAKLTTKPEGYEFALEDTTTPDASNFWTVNGTTAVYKNAVPAYYKVENGEIKYYAESSGTTYATIKNLASGLIVGTADHGLSNVGKLGYLDEDGTFVEAITIDTGEPKTVTIVKKEALGTSTATLEGDYKFVFDTTSDPNVKFTPERSYTWEVSNKNKAVMKATIGEGYTLSTDGKKITHSDAKESAVLTINGLSDAIIDGSGGNKGEVGIKVGNEFKAITEASAKFKDDGTIDEAGVITLPKEMLGTAKIEITGTEKENYSFNDINGVLDSNAPLGETSKWRVSNNAAKYTTYVDEYRQFDADKKTITYKAEAVKKDGSGKDVDLVTVTGLPKGFKVVDDKVVNADGQELITLNVNDSVITVNDAALNKGEITVTGDGYTIAETPNRGTKDEQFVWTISGTTATLKQGQSEGYNLESNDTKLKYYQANATKTLATITGLKSGLKVEGGKLGIYDGGVFKEVATVANGVITLKNYALGTTNITLRNESGQNYKLAEVTTPTDVTSMWVVSGTTATLKNAELAKFELDTDKTKLTRTAPKLSTVLATVKGIKKGTVADAFGKIDGISCDANKEITLSANVLDPKSKVSVTGTDYTLALDSGVTKPTTEGIVVWKVSGTTVTIGAGKTAGYVKDGDSKIIYQDITQDASPAITITNLKSGLKLNSDGTIDGITIDTNNSQIKLSKAVLGTNTSADKAMKLEVSGAYAGYKLALDTDVTTSETEKKWVISGTTASYKEVTPKGYTLANEDKSITYTAAIKNGTPTITITGLKKGIKLDQSGNNIEGVTVAGTADGNDNKYTITLDSRALGTTAVKLTKGENYKLALDTTSTDGNAVSSATESKKMWVVSGTTATYREVTPQAYTLASDGKSIKCQSAKYGKVYATVKGLKSGFDLASLNVEELKEDTQDTNKVTGYKVTLDNRALDKKEVTITGTGNKLAINTTTGDSNAVTPHEPSRTWTFNNGTATIVTTTPAGYKVVDNKIVYSTATTSKTTITGLKSEGITAITSDNQSAVSTYFDTDTAGVIKIKAAALDSTKKVSISGGDYTLALADDVNSGKTINYSWKLDGTTAIYQQNLPAGTYYCDGKTISYQANGSVKNLATIEGLAEGLKVSDNGSKIGTGDDVASFTEAITVDDGKITLNQTALKGGSSVAKDMVKITSNAYKLALDNSVNTETNKQSDDKWSFKSNSTTTAVYGNGREAYYTLSDDGRSVSYTPFKANEVKATLSNINKNGTLNEQELQNDILISNDNVVSLSKKIIEASPAKISISGKSNNKDYTLAFGTDITSTADGNKKTFGGEAFTNPKWYVNGTTITLEQGTTEKWVADETSATTKKSINYTAETHNGSSKSLATLTNLAKGLTPDANGQIEGITVTAPTKDASTGEVTTKGKIQISQEVLNQKDVALSKGANDYEIELSGVAEPVSSEPEISVSGTTATVKEDVLEGYELNKDTKDKITYTRSEEGKILAKVTGLKSGVTEDDVTLDTVIEGTGQEAKEVKVVKLGVGALGTSKVAIANQNGGNYKLALEDGVLNKDSNEVKDGTNQWSVSGSTATLKNVKPVYYELATDGKSVTVKSSTNSTIVAVSGLKSGLKAIDGEISGIEAIAPTYKKETVEGVEKDVLDEGGLIVLDAQSVLGTSTVKLGTGTDYKLQVDGYDSPEISEENWTNSKGSATLKGKISKGFTMSADERTLTHSSEVKSATLATIKGLNTSATLTADHLDTDSQTIALAGEDLTNKVTIGGGKYAFDFGADYENASITGSTAADVITVNGVGVSINAGKGDDYVSMYGYGTGEGDNEIGDTFIYASGDGNDVIADFSSYDKIKLTSGSITADSIKFGATDTDAEDDVVISIGTGSITLLDWDKDTEEEIHFITGNNTEQIFEWDGSASAFKLQTAGAGGGRAVLDEELVMNPTELTNTSSTIVTGGSDKK